MDAFKPGWGFGDDEDGGGIAGELSTWHNPKTVRPRNSQRLNVDMSAALRQRGASGVSVRVLDLSTHGFRAATHLELPEGADVWLRLPGLEPYHAKVAWSEGHYVGCAFERPLHVAVVEMIARKAASQG